MGLSLTQRAQDPQPIGPRERLERLTGFTASQLAAGMTWLAGYDPRTFDAVLDAVEPGPGLDDSDDPEPFCATCGIPIGIFLRLGLDWWHYRQAGTTAADGQQDHGDATAFGWFEVFDPGHEPVECMIGVALYQEAGEILAESLAVFRDRGNTASEAETLRLLGAVQDAVERWTVRPGLDDPTP